MEFPSIQCEIWCSYGGRVAFRRRDGRLLDCALYFQYSAIEVEECQAHLRTHLRFPALRDTLFFQEQFEVRDLASEYHQKPRSTASAPSATKVAKGIRRRTWRWQLACEIGQAA